MVLRRPMASRFPAVLSAAALFIALAEADVPLSHASRGFSSVSLPTAGREEAFSRGLEGRGAGVLRLRGGAEVGKGDPRWIVQERSDGKNVGNWHWEEKDMTQWSRQKLAGLVGIEGQAEGLAGGFDGEYRVSNVSRIGGDVVIHQRKGKLWPLCDLEISVALQGTMTGEGGEKHLVSGELFFGDVTVDERDDLEVAVTVPGAGAESDAFRKWLREGGAGPVVAKVQAFLDELQSHANAGREEVSKCVAEGDLKAKADEAAEKMARVNKDVAQKPPPTPATGAGGALTGTVSVEEEFVAGSRDIYECLVTTNRVCTFTRCSDTVMENKAGGRFSLWGGQVTGGWEELHPPEFLKAKWRMSDWPEGHFSSVRILLHERGNGEGCKLELHQEGVPADRVKDVERQWRERFFDAIKISFGYGSVAGARPF